MYRKSLAECLAFCGYRHSRVRGSSSPRLGWRENQAEMRGCRCLLQVAAKPRQGTLIVAANASAHGGLKRLSVLPSTRLSQACQMSSGLVLQLSQLALQQGDFRLQFAYSLGGLDFDADILLDTDEVGELIGFVEDRCN